MKFTAWGRVGRVERHIGRKIRVHWKYKFDADYTIHIWTGYRIESFVMSAKLYDYYGLTRGEFVQFAGDIHNVSRKSDNGIWTKAYGVIRWVTRPGDFSDAVLEPLLDTPFIVDAEDKHKDWACE